MYEAWQERPGRLVDLQGLLDLSAVSERAYQIERGRDIHVDDHR